MKKKITIGKLKIGKNVITPLSNEGEKLVQGGLPKSAYTKQSVCAEQCCNSGDWYCKTQ